MSKIVCVCVSAIILIGCATSSKHSSQADILLQPGDKHEMVLKSNESVTLGLLLPAKTSAELIISTASVDTIYLQVGSGFVAHINKNQRLVMLAEKKQFLIVNVGDNETPRFSVHLAPITKH